MIKGTVLLASLACALVSACAGLEDSPAFRVALDQCRNNDDLHSPDVQIQACTEIFNSPARYTDDLHWLYAERAGAYMARKDYALALADFDRALFEAPDNSALIFGKAMLYERMGNGAQALAHFDKAIQLAPRIDTLYYGRGRFLLDDGKHDLAIADFDETLRLDPSFSNARVARARAYIAKKVPGLAIQDLDKVIREIPDNGEAYWWRARAHFEARDNANAIGDFTEAMRLSPALTAPGLYWRGRAHIRNKDLDSALVDFDQGARIEPENATALAYKCFGRLVADRELDVGLAACNAALAIDPENVFPRFLSAAIMLKQGDAAGAEAGFDACARSRTPAAREDVDAGWGDTGVCLYGRGLARLRLPGTDEAKRAEIAREMLVALAAAPEAAGFFKAYGLEP